MPNIDKSAIWFARGARDAMFAALAVLAVHAAHADTPVGGEICTDITWTAANSPYVVTVDAGGTIVVTCGATLTIEPGVEVRFNDSCDLIVGNESKGAGTLIARGAAEAPITLKRGTSTSTSIVFSTQAADAVFDNDEYVSGCVFENVVISRCGVRLESSAPWFAHSEFDRSGISAQNSFGLRVEHCDIHDCPGTGLSIWGSVRNVRIANNTIQNNHGTGLFLGVVNSIVSDNVVASNAVGGIYAECVGTTFSGNACHGNATSSYGGGVDVHDCYDCTFIKNGITENHARHGGGLSVRGGYGGGNSILDNVIEGNVADYDGGGIYLNEYSSDIERNVVRGNSAGRGGGIYYYSVNGVVRGCMITENQANTEGGGIYVYKSAASISDCLIANNAANADATAGGIYARGKVSLAGDPETRRYNRIFNNSGYAVRAGEIRFGGYRSIDARYVDWGTCDADAIRAAIYDHNDDASLATVSFEPFIGSAGRGDMNCDCTVNYDDVDAFVDALVDRAVYETRFPDCDWWVADVNSDGLVNFEDIDVFVTCMIDEGCS